MAVRSIILWGVVIACQTINLAVGQERYCYEKGQECSPENWPGKCQDKTGQSPIDFPPLDKGFSNPTKTDFYLAQGCSKLQKFTASNSGDRVIVELEEPCYVAIATAKVSTTVNCRSIDFHWGQNRTDGSEHTFNGNKRTMEANINCWATRLTFEEALETRRKTWELIVISVTFYSNDMSNNHGYKPIVDCLKDIRSEDMFTEGSGLNISNFINVDDNGGILDLMYYPGSFTHPLLGDCYGNVGRFVKKLPNSITTAAMEEFYKLEGYNGQRITKNTRDIQELGDRKIEYLRAKPELDKEEIQGSGHRPGLLNKLPLPLKF